MKMTDLRAAAKAAPAETRGTLLALGTCSDPAGVGRTTAAMVAELSGQDRRTVQRHLARLQDEGRVVVLIRPGGRMPATRQILVPSNGGMVTPLEVVDNDGQRRHGVPSTAQPNGDTGAPNGGMVSTNGGMVPPTVYLDSLDKRRGAANASPVDERDDPAEWQAAKDAAMTEARAAIGGRRHV